MGRVELEEPEMGLLLPLLFSLPSWAVAFLSPLFFVRTWFGLILWLSTKTKQNKNPKQWLLRTLPMALSSFIHGTYCTLRYFKGLPLQLHRMQPMLLSSLCLAFLSVPWLVSPLGLFLQSIKNFIETCLMTSYAFLSLREIVLDSMQC